MKGPFEPLKVENHLRGLEGSQVDLSCHYPCRHNPYGVHSSLELSPNVSLRGTDYRILVTGRVGELDPAQLYSRHFSTENVDEWGSICHQPSEVTGTC